MDSPSTRSPGREIAPRGGRAGPIGDPAGQRRWRPATSLARGAGCQGRRSSGSVPQPATKGRRPCPSAATPAPASRPPSHTPPLKPRHAPRAGHGSPIDSRERFTTSRHETSGYRAAKTSPSASASKAPAGWPPRGVGASGSSAEEPPVTAARRRADTGGSLHPGQPGHSGAPTPVVGQSSRDARPRWVLPTSPCTIACRCCACRRSSFTTTEPTWRIAFTRIAEVPSRTPWP